MAGYYNYSMSNNAVDAYANGEKPFTKWTKQDLIDEILTINERLDKKLLQKVNVKTLKTHALKYAGWHHTSNHYNKTDFYKIDSDVEQWTNADVEKLIDEKLADEKPNEYKAICKYLTWTGTRKHPKATENESTGTIKGNWFYLPDGTKKSINGNGFKIIKKI